MKPKMKAFIALSAVIICLVYLLSNTKTASAAKGPKVTDKVGIISDDSLKNCA